MSDVTPEPDALETAHELTSALDGMTGQLKAVQHELQAMNERLARAEKRQDRADVLSRRIRHLVAGLTVSFCLDLLVTAGFGYNTVRLNDTQNTSHANLISACQSANVNRAEDIAIWNKFLGDLAPAGAKSAKVRAELAGINRLVRVKDAPRNCVAIYSQHPATVSG